MSKSSNVPYGKLHKAGEDYLETILVIEQEKGNVRSVDIAQHMNLSKPSVCRAISVLGQAGHLYMDQDHFIHLTEEGRMQAERIYERHCFFKDFLIEMGVDPELAEVDACQMEHDVSPESFEAIKRMRQRLED